MKAYIAASYTSKSATLGNSHHDEIKDIAYKNFLSQQRV